MVNRKILLVLTGLLLSVISVQAQSQLFNTWTSVSIDRKWNKWMFGGEAELRSRDFWGHTRRLSLQAEVSRILIKNVRAGASYTFINFYDSKYDDFQPRHRFTLLTSGKWKPDDFTFTLTEKLQLTTRDESDRIKDNGTIDTYSINPSLVWRNKLKAGYNIPGIPLNPSVSVETFFQMNNPEGNAFECMRYTLSLQYKLNKGNELEIFGLLDQELNVSKPTDTYVMGIGYHFSF